MSESALFCSKRLREAGEPGLGTHAPHSPMARAGGGAVPGRSCGGRAVAARFGCREEWGQRARGRRGGTWGPEQSHGGGGSRWRLVYLLSCFVSGSLRETEAAGRRISNWARGPLGLSAAPTGSETKAKPPESDPWGCSRPPPTRGAGLRCQFLPGKRQGNALPAEVRRLLQGRQPHRVRAGAAGVLRSHLWAGAVLGDHTSQLRASSVSAQTKPTKTVPGRNGWPPHPPPCPWGPPSSTAQAAAGRLGGPPCPL